MPDASSGKTILIAGPTASGKSAVAFALAIERSAEIVNADALQVYRDLKVLSARPSDEERARIPHHLFGHVDAVRRYSVGEWLRAAKEIVADITGRGRDAIIVGGTGLYFRALEKGLAEIPDIDADTKREAAARLDALGIEAFRAEVLSVDPAMAKLDPNDRQRHLRAFEVYQATGVCLSNWQMQDVAPALTSIDARIVIEPPRELLYGEIDARFDRMLAAGALDEARALISRGLHPDLPAMKAVGAAELMAHLRGEISLDDARAAAQRNSRRLAKRQMTWLRRQMPDWPRADHVVVADRRLREMLEAAS